MTVKTFKFNMEAKIIYSFFILSMVLVLTLATNINIASAESSETCPESIFPELIVCGRSEKSLCKTEDNIQPCRLEHIPLLFGNIMQFAIIFVLMLIPLYIMWIGLQMIIYREKADALSQLKKKILASIGFFILIFASWIIIRTVTEVFGVSQDIPSFLLNQDGSIIENPGPSIK
jgi:hypothetical protein